MQFDNRLLNQSLLFLAWQPRAIEPDEFDILISGIVNFVGNARRYKGDRIGAYVVCFITDGYLSFSADKIHRFLRVIMHVLGAHPSGFGDVQPQSEAFRPDRRFRQDQP